MVEFACQVLCQIRGQLKEANMHLGAIAEALIEECDEMDEEAEAEEEDEDEELEEEEESDEEDAVCPLCG